MSIRAIEQAPGKEKRSYLSGHVFKCFKCNLWVRWLGGNEMCSHCMKKNGLKETIPFLRTEEAVNARQEDNSG